MMSDVPTRASSSIPAPRSQNDYNNYFIRRGSGPLCLPILKVITQSVPALRSSGTASIVPLWLCYITTCNLVHHEFQVWRRYACPGMRARQHTIGLLCIYTYFAYMIRMCISRATQIRIVTVHIYACA